MKFTIQISYTTGDSFGHEDVIEDLDYEWNDEEIAKENLQAIANHYRAYQWQENSWRRDEENPNIDYLNEWWYREMPYGRKDEIGPTMWLLMDDMTKVPFSCPWIGYFETLNSIELKIKNERIDFN